MLEAAAHTGQSDLVYLCVFFFSFVLNAYVVHVCLYVLSVLLCLIAIMSVRMFVCVCWSCLCVCECVGVCVCVSSR